MPDKSERAASNGNEDGVAENHESPSNDKANELDADKTAKKPEDGAEASTEALRKDDPSQAPEGTCMFVHIQLIAETVFKIPSLGSCIRSRS